MPRKKTHEAFVEEIESVYKGKLKVLGTYEGNRTKVLVEYQSCGHRKEGFPSRLLNGQRCKPCFMKELNIKKRKTHETFEKEIREALDEDYTVVSSYKSNDKHVTILHTVCNQTFSATPYNLLRGRGCPVCAGNQKGNTEEFTKIVKELVNEDYQVLGEYVNIQTHIKMKHTVCGYEYMVTPQNFKAGRRCPKCNESKGERELGLLLQKTLPKYIQEKRVVIQAQYKDNGCRNKETLRFDYAVLDEEKNPILYLEYDGEQHYKPVCFNGISEEMARERYMENKERDGIKNMYCLRQKIPLIRIPYWQAKDMENALIKRIVRYVSR